jgi:hypothetical protein
MLSIVEIVNKIVEMYSSDFSTIKDCIESYRKMSGFRFVQFSQVLDETKHAPLTENLEQEENSQLSKVKMELDSQHSL